MTISNARREVSSVTRVLLVLMIVLVFDVANQSPTSGATQLNRRVTKVGHLTAKVASCTETKVLRTDRTSLRYPSCWKLSNYHEETTMTTVIDYMSNQPLHKPCNSKRSGTGTTTSCGFPLKSLVHGGVLVILIEGGSPGWTISLEKGQHLVVDDHAARQFVISRSNRSLHASDEIATYIAAGVPDNYYELWAFFRNPSVAEDQRMLRKMLNSMTIR